MTLYSYFKTRRVVFKKSQNFPVFSFWVAINNYHYETVLYIQRTSNYFLVLHSSWSKYRVRFLISSSFSGAQAEVFQRRGGFVELEHFHKLFVKNTRRKGSTGNNFGAFFLLDTFKTTIWMEDSTQGWTQLEPFFQNQGVFFDF